MVLEGRWEPQTSRRDSLVVLEGLWKAGRQMGGGKGTNESMGLVCGAGWQMGATNESTGLVSGAGRPMEGNKDTNESPGLVHAAG